MKLTLQLPSLAAPCLAILLFLTSCVSVDDCLKGVTVQNTSVTFETGMCYGKCPVYSATILGDGKIMYDGRRFTDREGIWIGGISRDKLCDLLTLIRQTDLSSVPSESLENVPDAPVSELRIVTMGKERTYKWNMGTPDALKAIRDFMVKNTQENSALREMAR
ncbi:MAG: DUF6438 domain-containing protein [Candidatus Kapaibacterium sp.]